MLPCNAAANGLNDVSFLASDSCGDFESLEINGLPGEK